MKDNLTLKKVIWTIIGFLVISLILIPLGETLIYQSRYKTPDKSLAKITNDEFDMVVNRFVASGRDGFVNVDIVKKNDKWKYAEVQVIDRDGYVIHREFVDLRDVPVGSKVNIEFPFKGTDVATLNIIGSDEIKEPITIWNGIKNRIKNSKIYKAIEKFYNETLKDKILNSRIYKSLVDFYNKYIKPIFNLDFNQLKEKVKALPIMVKTSFIQLINAFMALDPGFRAIILISIGYIFI